jgi:hypothetical protein
MFPRTEEEGRKKKKEEEEEVSELKLQREKKQGIAFSFSRLILRIRWR